MSEQLPLRALEAFVAVARARSLSRAATMLNITVPAVSRRVRILEQYLGAKLFDRLPRGLALTEAGERYFAELAPAWERMRNATLSARVPARRDAFRVSVIATFAANWLLPRLMRCRERFAGREIELETSADFVDLRARRDLDGAIRLGRGPARESPSVSIRLCSPTWRAGGWSASGPTASRSPAVSISCGAPTVPWTDPSRPSATG
jgi:DNA-binding transcriptional LysR family regulator